MNFKGLVKIFLVMTVVMAGIGCVMASSASGDALLGDGTYEVGKDLPAGEYYVKCNSYNLYIEVASDDSGDIDSVDYIVNTYGGAYITVKDGQFLEISGGDLYEVDKAPDTGDDRGYYRDAMYKVGKDIPAGEYEIESTKDQAYYEIASSSSHEIGDVVKNNNFKTTEKVTLEDGQYITLDNGAQIDIGNPSDTSKADDKTSSSKGKTETINGVDFNIPDGFKEDPDYAYNGDDYNINDVKMTMWGKTYEKGDDVISVGVATYDNYEVDDELTSRLGGSHKTVNGVEGYTNNINDYKGFIYAKDGKLVLISATSEDLIDDVVAGK